MFQSIFEPNYGDSIIEPNADSHLADRTVDIQTEAH